MPLKTKSIPLATPIRDHTKAVTAAVIRAPALVYEHLRWLVSSNILHFAIRIVPAGELHADLLAGAWGALGFDPGPAPTGRQV